MGKETTPIRVPVEFKEELDELKERTGKSYANIIREYYLDKDIKELEGQQTSLEVTKRLLSGESHFILGIQSHVTKELIKYSQTHDLDLNDNVIPFLESLEKRSESNLDEIDKIILNQWTGLNWNDIMNARGIEVIIALGKEDKSFIIPFFKGIISELIDHRKIDYNEIHKLPLVEKLREGIERYYINMDQIYEEFDEEEEKILKKLLEG